MEMSSFRNDLALKTLFSNTKFIWIWLLGSKVKYPVLCRVAWKVKALFSSTYLCEYSFSKYRN
nr:unnamed protein product [Callosobruchus chinensis]